MKKGIVVILVLLALFFGGGFVNVKGFQNKAKNQSENLLTKYFTDKGEKVKSFTSPDYSLGMIEVRVKTDKNTYYSILASKSSWIIEYTVLNYFMTPKVEILNVKQE